MIHKTHHESGFTLIELLVSMATATVMLAGAVMITSQVQNSYRRQVEDATAIQEGRFALDWVGKLVRGAGNNPFNVASGDCPVAGTVFTPIRFDPDLDGINDDIRLQSDSNPQDGMIGGDPLAADPCNQSNEDVTITIDDENHVIQFLDNNIGGGSSVRTDKVIDSLLFTYRDTSHAVTAVAADVAYVEITIVVRTRTIDPATGEPVKRTLTSEIRVRG